MSENNGIKSYGYNTALKKIYETEKRVIQVEHGNKEEAIKISTRLSDTDYTLEQYCALIHFLAARASMTDEAIKSGGLHEEMVFMISGQLMDDIYYAVDDILGSVSIEKRMRDHMKTLQERRWDIDQNESDPDKIYWGKC